MRLQGLLAVVCFVLVVFLDSSDACGCRYCSTASGRSFMDPNSLAEARTFDALFPCCNVCLDTTFSSLKDITNTKCGIKKAGTRRNTRRGGNKKNKNKNNKNKNKTNGNKKKGENKRKGRQDEDEIIENTADHNKDDYMDANEEHFDENDESYDDNVENDDENDENNDENNNDDNDEKNADDADMEETDNKKVNKRKKTKKSGTKIVGGSNAEENEYPWIVALTTKTNMNMVYCGGSLIASQWVLTAAHCIRIPNAATGVTTDTPASEINVKLGEHDTSDTDTQAIVMNIGVSLYILHPDYASTNGLLNDVALLKLEKAVDLNTYTPVCLPPKSTTYEGQTATAIGWGTLMSDGAQPPILQEVEVKVVPLATCTTNYAPAITITSAMVCAADTGKDSCQGDSGGPLTIPLGTLKQHFQVGITSFGDGCAVADKPGVYADVSFAREFILCTLSTNGGATFVPPAA